MAVSWLQSTSLLVLLAALCPGTEGFNTQHLCGPHLVDALNMVCADRGFYYNPRRDVHPFMNLFPGPAGGSQEQNEVPVKKQMEMIVKRGIVEECCHNPCSLIDLEKYCN